MVAIGIPVLLVKVDTSLGVLSRVSVGEDGLEVSGIGIELHAADRTLGEWEVRACKSLNLVVLERAILVPEALTSSTSRCGQVSIGLELPVSPTNKVVISNISNLIDLLSARAFGQTSTELGDDERNTKALSILSTLSNALLVPFEALVSMSNLRLTSGTFLAAELAAVSVIVKDMSAGANLSTWGSLEANREYKTGQNASLIGEWDRLEPHLLHLVVRLILLIGLLVHRSKILLVHVARGSEQRIADRVGREWLIEWIITDNVGIVGETS